jgi:DNA-directed RNA polymerase subunit RPC12/RpoP
MAGPVTDSASSGQQENDSRCPRCGHEEYRLSHRRNLFERAVSLAGIRPVRCLKCEERRFAFVGFGQLFTQSESAPPVKKAS